MRKKLILGFVLTLTLALTSPVVAAEGVPLACPSVDLSEWVLGLLEIFEQESSSAELGPGIDPGGEESPSAAEIGPAAEPGGEEPPVSEIGPAAEPGG